MIGKGKLQAGNACWSRGGASVSSSFNFEIGLEISVPAFGFAGLLLLALLRSRLLLGASIDRSGPL